MNTFGLNGMVLKCQPDRQQSQTTSADVACMRVTEDDHPTSWRVRLMFFHYHTALPKERQSSIVSMIR